MKLSKVKDSKRWPWVGWWFNPNRQRKFYRCARCGRTGEFKVELSLNNNLFYPGDREFVKCHAECKEGNNAE